MCQKRDKKNVDNGLVRRVFGKSTDEISEPTLHWATEQLSQQRHHLVLFSAFTVQVLMKVRLDEFTGDQVGQYVDRFDVLHEVIGALCSSHLQCPTHYAPRTSYAEEEGKEGVNGG